MQFILAPTQMQSVEYELDLEFELNRPPLRLPLRVYIRLSRNAITVR